MSTAAREEDTLAGTSATHPLRILIYGLNFAPELTGVGKYTGELAAWLAERGHAVRVVTSPPYYPTWSVFEGYHPRLYQRDPWKGVHVWRCPLWVPKKLNGITRLVHLASFALSSFPMMMRQVFWKPDVVWVVEPALLCAPAALLTARLSGARSWLHVQDFEIDAAFDLGLLKGGWIRRAAEAVERWLKCRFDVVSSISDRMLERLRDKGVAPFRVEYFPNWVDVEAIAREQHDIGLRQSLGIPREAVVALYSGNMGGKQGIEVLADAASLLKGREDIVFVFCGDGGVREKLEQRCEGLPNVRFIHLQPVEHLGALLQMADIHLLPQRAEAADLVMPSKLTGMLASGRPVVATASAGSSLASIVGGCGVVVPPSDAQATAQAIAKLAADPEQRRQLGEAGLRYARDHLDVGEVLSHFLAQLSELTRATARKQRFAVPQRDLATTDSMAGEPGARGAKVRLGGRDK